MVQHTNLYFTHLFPSGLEALLCAHSPGLCSSVSHALMHFQAHNDHLLWALPKSSSAFCGRIMDCSPVLQLAVKGWILLWRLYPLWIPMVSLPQCKRLLLPQCSAHNKHRSAWSQSQWVQVAQITGSPRKRKFWPGEKKTILSCLPSRTGLRYKVRQWHVFKNLNIF